MANLKVRTTENFDLLAFFNRLGQFVDPLETPEKINEDKVAFDISRALRFTVEGDFNAEQTDGTIEAVTFFQHGKAVLDVSETDLSLRDLITLAENGSETIISAFLTADSSIFGNEGNDVFFNHGNTKFYARGGDDVMMDDLGHVNMFRGQSGIDTVIYHGNETTLLGVTASLKDFTINTGEAAGDIYRSIENLVGTKYDDILIGDDNDNKLQGHKGKDILIGGAGADHLDGGLGFDFASYETYEGDEGYGVRTSLVDTIGNSGDAIGDVYKSIEGLIGSDYFDSLRGDSGNNTLIGGGDGDILVGGGGNDVIWGDAKGFIGFGGEDEFRFVGVNDGVKTIMDFHRQDRIMIDYDGFGLNSYPVDKVTFISAYNPSPRTDQNTFLYNRNTHEFSFDADGTGSMSEEVLARIRFSDDKKFLDIDDIFSY